MDWLGDYLRFCLEHGFGGLALLLLSGGAVLIAALLALAGLAALGRAFARGWHQGGTVN